MAFGGQRTFRDATTASPFIQHNVGPFTTELEF